MVTCSLLLVGDELLDGRTADTNSDFIVERLDSLGITVAARLIVGDSEKEIASALSWLRGFSELIIVTGGLGPTGDDLTREAVAGSLGLPLRRDAEIERAQRAFFAAMGREMSPTNLRQADLVEGAEPIMPRLGTAPGQWIDAGDAVIVLLPGVPREMRDMLEGEVLPRIESRFALGERKRALSLLVAARPESEVAEAVEGSLAGVDGVDVSYRAMMGQIEVRVSSWDDAGEKFAAAVAKVREALGPWVVAEGGESLEEALGRELRSRGLTLAAAESCTGGMVGERITRVPGSSDYFLGGLVAYTYTAKEELLGVDGALLRGKGAVSEEVAEAMARGVRSRFSSDIGIAVTGVAGPDSGGEREPVGTVAFGVADAGRSFAWKYRLPGDRDMVRNFATSVMLAIVLFFLRGEGEVSVR